MIESDQGNKRFPQNPQMEAVSASEGIKETPTEASKSWLATAKKGVLGLLDGAAGSYLLHQGVSSGDLSALLIDGMVAGDLLNQAGKAGIEVLSRKVPQQKPKDKFVERVAGVGNAIMRMYTSETFAIAMINAATHGDWRQALGSALIAGYMGIRSLRKTYDTAGNWN